MVNPELHGYSFRKTRGVYHVESHSFFCRPCPTSSLERDRARDDGTSVFKAFRRLQESTLLLQQARSRFPERVQTGSLNLGFFFLHGRTEIRHPSTIPARLNRRGRELASAMQLSRGMLRAANQLTLRHRFRSHGNCVPGLGDLFGQRRRIFVVRNTRAPRGNGSRPCRPPDRWALRQLRPERGPRYSLCRS